MATDTAKQNGEMIRRDADDNAEAGFNSRGGFDLIQRAATLLANSSLVPKEYQNNIPNCVVALNMANRIGADPLMVMQNLYVVHGRPGWSAQFLIATFNQSGRFSALRYEWGGDEGKDNWKCRAYAEELTTGEVLYGAWISIALTKKEGWYAKSGSKWQSMPQQMLMYRSAAWFVRAYAPEIAMGLHTADELIDAGPERQHQQSPSRISNTRTPSETLADKLEGKAAPAPTEQLSPEVEYLARIDAAVTIEDQNAIANDIEADLQDGTLTGSEASNLKKLLMEKAER